MPIFDHEDYDQVFPLTAKLPYTRHYVQEVDASRSAFGGTLFIDRVLAQLGISKNKVYPPKSEDNLRALHKVVTRADLAEHLKLSVFYYLLLDFDMANPSPSPSEAFASLASVAEQYKTFMRGLWHLDHQQLPAAVQCLTHPSLTSEFADDIIVALVSQVENGDYELPLAYYHTVRPALKTSRALEALFEAKAHTNVTSALDFTRQHPESTRQKLFEQLIASVLDDPTGEEPADRATELVSLPFHGAEETWFQDFLTRGEGKKLRKSADTLLMRKIVTGKYADVLGNKNIQGRWGTVLEGFKRGIGERNTWC